MQKVFAIIALLCCVAFMGRANEAPPARVKAVDTNTVERVLLDCADNVAVLACFITHGSNIGVINQKNMNFCKGFRLFMRPSCLVHVNC